MRISLLKAIYFTALTMVLVATLSACSKPSEEQQQEQVETEQYKKLGYENLIAMPVIADYALPFCEDEYCIDVEVFGFKSKDRWFNDFGKMQSADLIRQQLGISQKLSLQRAVNEFVKRSDAWRETQLAENKHAKPQAWSMYIKPRLAMQQGEMALLIINTSYQLGDETVPEQHYFYVVDRKAKRSWRLYDAINENKRVSFTHFVQAQYDVWREETSAQLSEEDQVKLPTKIYWANQDWFFDEQGVAIYYRFNDLCAECEASNGKGFTIYLSPTQSQQWIKAPLLKQLNFAS
ncbi:hypothetical protein [Acinetobacter sp.]|uniref:hypothetical protein n=1 Tax=Acinetobacter sp. TaxID=472 RepID=UPI0035B42A78